MEENYMQRDTIITNFRKKVQDCTKSFNNFSVHDVESDVHLYVKGLCDSNDLDVEIQEVILTGSTNDGSEPSNSNLNVVVEYKGNFREDALFNILHESKFELAGRMIDINPIRECETGSLEVYLQSLEKYLDTAKLSLF